jgi:flagellar basal-body rod protein FlgB
MRIGDVDQITALLTDFLDVQSRRAEVVASNLANADTPGFQAKELDFNEHLRTAAQRALLPLHASGDAEPPLANTLRVVEQTGNTPGLDGNTVDNGREMATLADVGMRFLTGTQLLQARFRALRTAIREGK